MTKFVRFCKLILAEAADALERKMLNNDLHKGDSDTDNIKSD